MQGVTELANVQDKVGYGKDQLGRGRLPRGNYVARATLLSIIRHTLPASCGAAIPVGILGCLAIEFFHNLFGKVRHIIERD